MPWKMLLTHLKAAVDRPGDVLRLTCPHCQFTNEFPELDMVYIFLCHNCCKSVDVEELKP